MTDRLRRLDIKIRVSYGTNIELVMQTLLKCAKDQKDILTNPAPYVLFNDFAESYLEFELRCWTSHPDWIFIRSDKLRIFKMVNLSEDILKSSKNKKNFGIRISIQKSLTRHQIKYLVINVPIL